MVRLVDQDEPVLVFTGYVLPEFSHKPSDKIRVKMTKNSIVTLPAKIHDFFSFMTTPQYKDDVYIAIANAGGNISDVDRMLETALIRVVPPGHNDISLYALSGLKLVPIGYKVTLPEIAVSSSRVYIGHREDQNVVCSISPLLAAVLWDAEEDEDFSDAVRRLGVEAGLRDDIAIRQALSDLDELLGHGLARWENLTDPKPATQRPVSNHTAESTATPARPFGRMGNLLFKKISSR